MTVPAEPGPDLDFRLLGGFRFACRPDCGLCCYAEPIVSPSERSALLRIVPEAEFVRRGADEFLRSAPDGGACGLLAQNRCRAHAARPSPCREFPITVHLGTRAQATLVLSCPGLDLAPLDRYRGSADTSPPRGLDGEISAVRDRAKAGIARRVEEGMRRRRRIVRRLSAESRWEEEEAVRERLRRSLPRPGPEEFPAEEPPDLDEGLESLPLVFAERAGPVGLARGLGGWEMVELRPEGGIAAPLGVVPPPTRPPSMSEEAERRLEGYLRYWLERDALFGYLHLAMLDSSAGTVGEWAEAELARIGATALSRAAVLARLLPGGAGPLSAAQMEAGIRATDQDLLDRPTWGSRL